MSTDIQRVFVHQPVCKEAVKQLLHVCCEISVRSSVFNVLSGGEGSRGKKQKSCSYITTVALTKEEEEELKTLPSTLWSRNATDVGLIKNQEPVKVKTISSFRPIKPQYPLSPQQREGIRSVIADMLKAGILTQSKTTTCNTPIFPVKKANTGKYRSVHDLRAINEITETIPPVVANPHTILNQITPKEQWFSVIDLSNAFFSVPLHPDSQDLFGFTYEGQKYTYTRLPQGFQNSPTLYAEALEKSMSTCTYCMWMTF